MRSDLSALQIHAWAPAAVWLPITLAGCLTPLSPKPAEQPGLAPTADRLVAAYPDLASKKFQILADFEDPAQASLFQLAADGRTQGLAITTERAQRDTGVGSLKVSLLNSRQRVIVGDSPNSRWALHRDWAGYHLILVSVFSPRELGGFTFSVTSGVDLKLTYTHERVFLKPGWNLLRIDLADMADQINLADVRQIAFWCEPLDTPVDLYLDDLILVNNETPVFGRADREAGELYVTAKGRRLVVGAAERFELVFHRGRILQWFDLSADPQRLRNLVGPGLLGPTPTVLTDDTAGSAKLDDPTQWSGLGPAVESYQGLQEITSLHVVLQGQWRFGERDQPASEQAPSHRWRYTIYRDGRIYIACTGTARTERFQPAGMGLAFHCDGSQGFRRELVTMPSRTADPAAAAQITYALFSRPDRGAADLLVVPARPTAMDPINAPPDPLLTVLCRLAESAETFTFASLVKVWPTDIDTPLQSNPIATDYTRPLPIEVDTGRLVRTDEGDFNNDGFSEAGGYYVLQLDGNVAKIRIDGRTQLRFSPTFKIVDVGTRDLWVYVNGKEVQEVYRERNGDAVFSVLGAVGEPVLIEVTSRLREAPITPGPG